MEYLKRLLKNLFIFQSEIVIRYFSRNISKSHYWCTLTYCLLFSKSPTVSLIIIIYRANNYDWVRSNVYLSNVNEVRECVLLFYKYRSVASGNKDGQTHSRFINAPVVCTSTLRRGQRGFHDTEQCLITHRIDELLWQHSLFSLLIQIN